MPSSKLLLASKVVVTEEPPSIRTVAGVPTSVAGFLGVTERGPVRSPIFFTSFEEYVREFGGRIAASDLPLAIEHFFVNGGTQAWVSRTCHYTDNTNPATATAVKGAQTLADRGGAAGPAMLTSVDGPFALATGETLVLNIDGAGNQTATFTAIGATITSAAQTYDLSGNNKTFIYQVILPRQTTLEESDTITFVDADFAVPAAATAAEVVAAINTRARFGIKAHIQGGTAVRVVTDKAGTGASLVISGTALTPLGGGFVAGTTGGTGNVADILVVTATEIKTILDALPLLLAAVVSVIGAKVRISTAATGVGADIVLQAASTASGIFAGVLPLTVLGTASAISNTATFEAQDPGTWIASYSIVIAVASDGSSTRFDYKLTRDGRSVEAFPNLSMTTTDARYFADFINNNSGFVAVTDLNSPAASPNDMPALGTFNTWTGQNDGLVGLVDADFAGSQAGGTGLFAFDEVDNIGILAVPGRATSAVHNAMVTYAETTRDGATFTILDPPSSLDEQGIKTYVETTAALFGLSEFGAIYWPRTKVLNPQTSIYGTAEQIVVPPSGQLAGLYARIDASTPGGVYLAPAGPENGLLRGVLGFETEDTLDERKRDVVYPSNINPITKVGNQPRFVDGSRTLKTTSNFPSIPERRGVIFIAQSLKQSLLFAKHRNNDARLRRMVHGTCFAFLLRQHQVGAFRGTTPEESFFVDVSDELNPIEVIFAGQLIIRIGLATQKPAEFIILKITQDTRAFEERISA